MASMRAGLRFRRLLTWTLTGAGPAMAACSAHFIIGLAPIDRFLVGKPTVALEGGPKFDRRHFYSRLPRIGTAFLRSGTSNEYQRGYGNENLSHNLLDIDRRAETRAGSARHTGARRLSQPSESERRFVEAGGLDARRRGLRVDVRCFGQRRKDQRGSGRGNGCRSAASEARTAVVALGVRRVPSNLVRVRMRRMLMPGRRRGRMLMGRRVLVMLGSHTDRCRHGSHALSRDKERHGNSKSAD